MVKMENMSMKAVRSIIEVPEELRDHAEAALMLGMNVEMCGEWLWLKGDSFKVKDELKKVGFRWSAKKARWYWSPKMKGYSWVNWSMEEIRSRYGSEKIA